MDLITILNIVFFAMFGLALLGAIWGLITSLYNVAFTAVIKAALIIILIIATPSLASMIGDIDLTAFLPPTVEIFGNTIHISSVSNTLVSIISSFDIITPINGMSLYATILSLVTQIIAYATFFTGMILILILGNLLGGLFYALTIRFAVSAHRKKLKNRGQKPKKGLLRLTGALGGYISSFVCISLAIAPLSSLVSTVSNSIKDVPDEKLAALVPNEYANYVKEFKNLNNSYLFQFYSMLGNFDVSMMDYVTTSINQSTQDSLYDTLNSLLALVKPASDAVQSIDYNNGGKVVIDTAVITSESFVTDTVKILVNNSFLMNLLPSLVNIGVTYVGNSTNIIDSTKLDLSGIKYSDELTTLSEVYSELAKTGLVSSYVNDNKLTIDYSKKGNYVNALAKLGESKIITQNMPYLLSLGAQAANSAVSANMLDVSPDAYKDIDWKTEFRNLGTIIFDLAEAFGITEFSASALDQFKDINAIAKDDKKVNALKKALTGEFEKKGDSYEITYTGLLDLQFVKKGLNIPQMISSLIGKINDVNKYIDTDVLKETAEEISKDHFELLIEIRNLLDAASFIIKKDLVNGFDINNEEKRQDLNSLLDIIEDSKLLNQILPNVLRQTLYNSSPVLFEGFSYNNINYEGENLISSIRELIDVFPLIQKITDNFNSDGNFATKIKNLNIDDLHTILETIINNKILNPDQLVTAKGEYQKDFNINSIIRSLLSDDSFKGMGIVVPDNIMNIAWSSTEEGQVTELDNLCNVLRAIQSNIDSIYGEDDQFTFANVSGKQINEILSAFANSDVFRPSLNNIMNTNLSPMMEGLGVNLHFKADMEAQEWVNIATHLGMAFDTLKAIPGVDLNDTNTLAEIDWLELDPILANSILTNLYVSNLIGVTEDANGMTHDTLGALLYNNLAKTEFVNILGDNISENDFTSVDTQGGVKFQWVENTDEIDLGDFNEEYAGIKVSVAISGEISDFTNVLLALQEVNTDSFVNESGEEVTLTNVEALTSGRANEEGVAKLLQELSDTYLFGGKIGNVINSFTSKTSIDVEGSTIDLSAINTEVFSKLSTQEERYKEIEQIMTIYSVLKTRDLTEEEKQWYLDNDKEVPQTTNEFNEIFNRITHLEEDQFTTLSGVLHAMNDSLMFSTAKEGRNEILRNEFALTISHFTHIDEVVTNIKPIYEEVEGENGQMEEVLTNPDYREIAQAQMQSLIYSLNHDLWSEQMDNMIDCLRQIQGIENLMDITDANKLLADPNPEDGEDEYYLINILRALNKSPLLHQGTAGIFERIFEDALHVNESISNYLVDKSETIVNKNINYRIFLNYSDDSIKYWEAEIDALAENLSFLTIENEQTGERNFDVVTNFTATKSFTTLASIFNNFKSFTFNKEYYLAYLLQTLATPQVFEAFYNQGIFTKYEDHANTEDTNAYSLKRNIYPNTSSGIDLDKCGQIDGLLQQINGGR